MITGLDHVVLLLSDIDAGTAAYETLFGRAPSWRASGDGTDRVLFTLDNMTLELMSPSGESVAADRIRTVIKIGARGSPASAFATDDIARMHRRLERVALKPDPIAEVERQRHDFGRAPALEAHAREDRADAGRADVLSRARRPASALAA